MKASLLNISFIICLSPFALLAQKQCNTWVFGNRAVVNFNNPANKPDTLTGYTGVMAYGMACISDESTGELLCFTDGVDIYDKSYTIMPGGSGAGNGGAGSYQTCIIVRKPGSSVFYYVFTQGYYSIVDMSATGNGTGGAKLGDVVAGAKMVPYTTHYTAPDGITAARHSSGTDAWIISKESGSLYAYKLTSSGISTTPVVSAVHSLSDGVTMKVSPNGKWLVNVALTDTTALYSFNATTGVFGANPVIISTGNGGSGSPQISGAFSPDNSKLYTTISFDPSETTGAIYQYDLNASDIRASRVNINNGVNNTPSGIQLAPDGKIYITNGGINDCANAYGAYGFVVQVINCPNKAGLACDLECSNLGVDAVESLPNFLDDVLDRTNYKVKANFSYTAGCPNSMSNFNDTCTGNIDSWIWNFGDPSSGSANSSSSPNPDHTFSNSGDYSVKLIVTDGCITDSITQIVSIPPTILTGSLNDTCFASSTSIVINAGNSGSSYLWAPGGETTQKITVTKTGKYSVVVSNACASNSPLSDELEVKDVCDLEIPNIFSPNGDGKNDDFLITALGYDQLTCTLYDRWGVKIYGWDGTDGKWDGKSNTKDVTDGVYYYVVNATSLNGKNVNKGGYVQLVR